MASAVFITVVLLRFTVPLLIPRFPLPAILACLVIDAADQTIFQAFTDDPLPGYQTYDKALDVYYLAIAYFSTMRTWRDPVAFQVARFLYLYRLVGVTLFELLDQRWLLLVFPNTFEYFFITYEFVRTRWNPLRLSASAVVGMAAFIWIVVKLPQEWWIHVAQLDFTDAMDNHPAMRFVLAALAIIAAGIVYANRRRIPTADWPFTVRVDTHLPPGLDENTVREPFWSAVLVEKAALLALISVIFAQVLPDTESGNLAIALGVVVLVVANAAVSQLFRIRGRTWTSAAGTFVATLAINAGLMFVDSLFGPRRSDDTPALNALFFVLLLSMLISIFDRYRATRAGMEPGPGVWASVRAARASRRLTSA